MSKGHSAMPGPTPTSPLFPGGTQGARFRNSNRRCLPCLPSAHPPPPFPPLLPHPSCASAMHDLLLTLLLAAPWPPPLLSSGAPLASPSFSSAHSPALHSHPLHSPYPLLCCMSLPIWPSSPSGPLSIWRGGGASAPSPVRMGTALPWPAPVTFQMNEACLCGSSCIHYVQHTCKSSAHKGAACCMAALLCWSCLAQRDGCMCASCQLQASMPRCWTCLPLLPLGHPEGTQSAQVGQQASRIARALHCCISCRIPVSHCLC